MKKKIGIVIALLTLIFSILPTQVRAEVVDDSETVAEEKCLDLESAEPAEELIDENDNGVADFIERLYNVALGRASEQAGKDDWINRTTNQGYTGADLAKGFLFSPEFLNKNTDNPTFLTVLYHTFFDREPDTDGFNYWLERLNNGLSRTQVINGFIYSQEYINLCNRYGIVPNRGENEFASSDNSNSSDNTNARTANVTQVRAFVTRLYETLLSRTPAESEVDYWTQKLVSGEMTGTQVAEGFVFSEEFKNDINYKQQLIDFYAKSSLTVLDKELPESEKAYIISEAKKVYTDRQIEILINWDTTVLVDELNKGFWKNDHPGNGGFFRNGIEYKLTDEEKNFLVNEATENYWVYNSEPLGSAEFFPVLRERENYEFLYLRLRDKYEKSGFVCKLYKALFNRTPSESELHPKYGILVSWLQYLMDPKYDRYHQGGFSYQYVFAGFTESQEWNNLCESYGIICGTPSKTISDLSYEKNYRDPNNPQFPERPWHGVWESYPVQ